ncbi:hypothetical protein [Xanthomonas arboricola]|uniref:Avirulence protein n=5 Tax=Xanthomonas arboricola TaxID=56448 RepID=A0AAP4NIV2_9XANT|nr:hypothetical protein [Xanthomonas arboricola]KCX01635.1 hypothetical protein DK27_04995 [Xanthomonas arboricola pv. pruni]KPN11355.1 hypothetical protein AN652_06445 [Xanthomonas arboricola pv. pruni]MDN0265390.1 hypothetical protein [Xanthomonas arboricola pv. pruni]MDN0269257.1 hypothetical protein [Xanthomonas arboricola pv. pruni]MDN0273366.1 hypothetical protein [Xanthomonas arboricola pv. pruni]
MSSLVTAAAQIAADIDNVRSDAANEMAVGNDLTALGYAGAPRRARCHANGHATAMGGTVQGNAVLGGLTVWHAGATIGADAQASTVFMRRPGAFGAVNIADTTQVRGDIELRKDTTPTQGMFYGYADGAAMRNPEFGVELSQAVPEITARPLAG